MKSVIQIAVLSCILFSCQTAKKESKKAQKPNVVFIFTDDQTYSSIHALGNNEIITPNMDKLVQGGATFTHAYNMGSWSGAVCAASRAMLNSGRFVWRANKFRKNWYKNDSLNQTWSKLMEAQGYDTYMTGKWHVDAKAHKVFQNTTNVRGGMPKDAWDHHAMVEKFKKNPEYKKSGSEAIMPVGYNRPKDKNDKDWTPTDTKFGGFWEGGQHWSEALKDDAINFIQTAKEKENPFFMYLAFNAPHDPRQAPQEYQDMYSLENISVPKSYVPENPYRHGIANSNDLRDEALAPFPRTEFAVKTHIKEYYASITHVDAQIGLIVEALEKSGKLDNTYIIFTADHGLAMGRHGFLGKQNLFDHSIRPPMVILGPDVLKNKRINADVYLQDAMATSLEIAGATKPSYIDFNSFLDLAKGTTQKSHYDEIYGAYLGVQRMIRKDGFKLLIFPEIKEVLLFDLNKDPEEMNDLAKKPEYQEKTKTLFKDLLQLQKEMDDPLDISEIIKL
ncbi:sulfatase-like hydrolase/transferase [Flavicella sediminum]|uniref:sulfatase-like hydrolase/transferase n=1 Tax=Flavicella sediminum TaxID=2585141 RepID=UPI001121EC89|nr:sulfatase-like hydrolase/transferase [Flavicella sediminum]